MKQRICLFIEFILKMRDAWAIFLLQVYNLIQPGLNKNRILLAQRLKGSVSLGASLSLPFDSASMLASFSGATWWPMAASGSMTSLQLAVPGKKASLFFSSPNKVLILTLIGPSGRPTVNLCGQGHGIGWPTQAWGLHSRPCDQEGRMC